MFTKTEETILDALPKEYKYIFRSRSGELRISGRFDDAGCYLPICEFNHLFKDVKADTDPICFRKPILNDVEREYLKTILKPFHEKVSDVVKHRDNSEDIYSKEYLYIAIDDGDFTFPSFDSGKMYAGMELDKEYTLDELGITYDWRWGGIPDAKEYTVKLTAGNMRYIGRAIEVYERMLQDRFQKEVFDEIYGKGHFEESIKKIVQSLSSKEVQENGSDF